MFVNSVLFIFINLCVLFSSSYTTQAPQKHEEQNNFLDMATTFLEATLSSQNSGSGGDSMAGIAQLVGSLMQSDNKGNNGGIGAAQILSGLSSLLANANGGGRSNSGGIDPALIGNVLQMFSGGNDDDEDEPPRKRRKRANSQDNGNGLEGLMSVASMFLNNAGNNRGSNGGGGDSLISLLPMVMQAVNSFSGAEGENVHARHKDHEQILPPFLERIHVMWDHFSNSELAATLWEKSGLNTVFRGFTGRDGKLDYDKLLESLNNQSFRRRWLKTAIVYLSDWVNYLSQPEVYRKYTATAHTMFNTFLTTQGAPQKALFDQQRPSETISNLLDWIARTHLNTKLSTITYVKPAVKYAKDLIKIGHARGLLQKFNATEMSDKLTDTVNLEVIEPVLKVHRAYRFALRSPRCDKYVLCEINTHDPKERLELAGFKSGITRFSSMAAAWFISQKTKTPFWDLFGVINDPYECKARYPSECARFIDGEAKVTTEYIHNEL